MEERNKPNASKATKQAQASNPWSNASTGKKVAVGAAAAGGAVLVAKKVSIKAILIAILCFVLAGAIGAGVCFFMGKDDCFSIVGNEEVTLTLDQNYADEGVFIKEFGFDLSKNAKINTNLKQNGNGEFYAESVGTYYIAYTVNSLKFGFVYHIQKIRLITFVEASEGGE